MIDPATEEFVVFLETTLIPDLRDSGTTYTAADFARACRIIRDLDKRLGQCLENITSDPA